jgi:hypothetical protein
VDNLQSVSASVAEQWLEQAEFLSLNASLDYIDLIINLAGTDRTGRDMFCHMTPAIKYASLFEGMPEEGLKDEGAFVARLSWSEWQHRTFLVDLMRYWGGGSRLMLAITPLVFDEMKNQLLAMSQFEWENQTGIFRFYDSRIFPELFSHVLSEEQQALFTRIAFYWGWLDRDGIQTWKQGSMGPNSTIIPEPTKLTLTDRQIEIIGCISDAETLARSLYREETSRETTFRHCFDAALAASREGFWGELGEYVQQYEWFSELHSA